jgi:dephospho-CoA kinase
MAYIVGLTGGIGSGKSAAAAIFARLGIPVIDTDAIAHELTAAGGAAIAPIRNTFGSGFIAPDGALDRSKMRDAVFADAAAKRRLEAILHPLIRNETEARTNDAKGPYVVQVVPLLVESESYREHVQRVLVVDCREETQVARTMDRSRLGDDQVRAIMAAQAPRAARRAAADDIIDNDGELARLRPQVEALHERYLALAATMSKA